MYGEFQPLPPEDHASTSDLYDSEAQEENRVRQAEYNQPDISKMPKIYSQALREQYEASYIGETSRYRNEVSTDENDIANEDNIKEEGVGNMICAFFNKNNNEAHEVDDNNVIKEDTLLRE